MESARKANRPPALVTITLLIDQAPVFGVWSSHYREMYLLSSGQCDSARRGAEHQRDIARSGDAGEHGQPALQYLVTDVLQVVHARRACGSDRGCRQSAAQAARLC